MPIGFAPVTASPSGVVGFINTPPIPPASAGVVAAVAAAATVSTALVVAAASAYLDLQQAQRDLEKATKIGESAYRLSVSAGNKENTKAAPYTGGGFAGVKYDVEITKVTYAEGSTQFGYQLPNGYRWFNISGAIGGVSVKETSIPIIYRGNTFEQLSFAFKLSAGQQTEDIDFAFLAAGFTQSEANKFRNAVADISVRRRDGQQDKNVTTSDGNTPAGYTGNSGLGSADSIREGNKNTKPIIPASLSPSLGWGNGKPLVNGVAGAVGQGLSTNASNGKVAAPETDKPRFAPNPSAPSGNPSVPPSPSPNTPPSPSKTPQKPDEEKKAPANPTIPKPPDPTLSKVSQDIAQLGAILGTISANTAPEAQQMNAKTGACNALNSPSCTKKIEENIKNPLNQNIDTAKAALAANQAGQDIAFASVISKLDAAKEFAEKVARAAKLDKVYNLLTFITVTHNAAMLSNSLFITLEDALSQGLAVFGIKDGDSPININEVINKTTQDTVKSIIGEANYTNISERWAGAIRVYQAGANIVFQVRSLWDSARSLAELTGANVGQLMNALRRDGVVSENAYPAKSESPSMVNRTMERLQNLEQTASHLSSITSTSYGITQTVDQIKTDKANFDKLVKESPLKNGIKNDAAAAKDASQKAVSNSPAIPIENLVKPD